MPNAYTMKIAEGQTFKDFATGCAMAFLPDRSSLVKIEVNDFNLCELGDSMKKLVGIANMTPEELDAAAIDDYQRLLKLYGELEGERAETEVKYHAMRDAVIKFDATTPMLAELKDFMLSRIDEGIALDCGADAHPRFSDFIADAAKSAMSGQQWRDLHFRRNLESVHYHSGRHLDIMRLSAERNGLVDQLNAVLECGGK